MYIDNIKERLTEYVERITEHTTKGNKKAYNCPICHSGKGENGTGAFNINPKDNTSWRCFSCGNSGDIFNLIGLVRDLETFNQQLQYACEFFNIDFNSNDIELSKKEFKKDNFKNAMKVPNGSDKKENYSNYFKECNKQLAEFLKDKKEYRGISLETLNRFKIGYDKRKDSVVIPTMIYSYLLRSVTGEFKQKVGESNPINLNCLNQDLDAPIFIVEGEIDALSLEEIGYKAVGLGSTANANKLIEKLSKIGKLKKPLIVSLDNDKAGNETTLSLTNALKDMKIEYVVSTVTPYKDPNEFLQADRESFEKWAKETVKSAKTEQERYLDTSAKANLNDFINGIADNVNTPCVKTGFENLDSALGGGLYEGLYIIGAISSLGKTTLTLQIADQIAQNGTDVLFFSLEMSRSEIMSKSISRHTILEVLDSGLDKKNAKTTRGITNGERYSNYSDTEKELIKTAISKYSEYAGNIYIQEGLGDIGVMQIRETVEKHVRFTGKTPIVIVDYIQILDPYNERATDKQNTDKAVMELKRISRDFKTTVFGISSFNRDNYRNAVSMQSFKESGAIEYSSDVLLGLQFKGVESNDFDFNKARNKDAREIELVVLKNRNGKSGNKVGLNFYPMFNFFKE